MNKGKIVQIIGPVVDIEFADQLPEIYNALTVEFTDGKRLKEVVCEYPIGHKRRRKEGIPLLEDKFRINLARRFPSKQQQAILAVSLDQKALESMPVNEYVDLYVI